MSDKLTKTDKQIVLKALRTPYKRVLDFAMTYVSMSKKERECVFNVIVDGETEETAAEMMGVSRDFVAKHKASGLEKIAKAWEHCEVLPILIDYDD